jgi:hypothetical protein
VKTAGELRKRLLILVLIAFTMAACGSAVPGINLGDAGSSTVPSSTSSTTGTISTSTTEITPSTTSTTAIGPAPAQVGGTLSMSTSPVLGPGTPLFNVTLNQVIDPAAIQVPNHSAPQGERFVEMNVTIANVGSATLPIQEGVEPYVLGFTWYLNPSDKLPDKGLIFTQDFLSATCQGVPQSFSQDDLSPGQSLTGCVQFGPILDSVTVTGFEASLAHASYLDYSPAVWSVS